uniref:molybdopterin converting factor subunit 1 n=1 Tax=Ningiella ruwaisensis TaxID=2364274 RepID=UPI00109EFBF1|nr:molybdopterin converting factor subunit 1 [Ningiella ruwaisensis]
MINIKFFADFRERAGVASLKLEQSGETTVASLVETLLEQNNDFEFLSSKNVLIAVNQTLSASDAKINDGDEVAFFPPVTGG